ncbi:MAG: hypothetical protein JNK05_17475 [Myxococcales bacterium]|nr:hypothetical protein [Myxococcales bacterium]
MTTRAVALMLGCLVFVCCQRYQPAAPWSPPDDDAHDVDALDADARHTHDAHDDHAIDGGARSDAATNGDATADGDAANARRCVTHALPPEDLSATPTERGGVSVAYSGRAWGVAWTERVDGEDAVYFVSVGENGRRIDTPVRVTERGYRGRHPHVLWNGEQWMLFTSSSAARFDEIWLQRLDARGALVGRARRLTARDRHDRYPTVAPSPTGGWILAFSAEIEPRRHQVIALRLGAWGQQLSPPVELVERTTRITDVSIAPMREGLVVTWSTLRSSTFAIEGVRTDGNGQRITGAARVVTAPHGLVDQAPRAALVDTSRGVTLAWEQWTHGSSGTRLAHFTRRLSSDFEAVTLEDPQATLRAPALATLDDETIVLAVQRSAGELDQSVLIETRTLDDRALGARIRIRGHEGVAERPLVSVGRSAIAVVTRGPRGLALHRVPLVECPP